MKKLLLIILALYTYEASAQSFSFTTEHTTLSDTLGSEIVFDFLLINTSQDTIIVYLKRTYQQLPEGWESSFCFDISCFPPFIDSVATTVDFGSAPIPPGDTVDFSHHFYTSTTNGTGITHIFAANLDNPSDSMSVFLTATTAAVSVNEHPLAASFRLYQNYPNPFNPSTDIFFELDTRSNISLDVYSITGEKIAVLAEGDFPAGIYKRSFNGTGLASGLYIVKLNSGGRSSLIKLLLEK